MINNPSYDYCFFVFSFYRHTGNCAERARLYTVESAERYASAKFAAGYSTYITADCISFRQFPKESETE